jgi:hypothetical protein
LLDGLLVKLKRLLKLFLHRPLVENHIPHPDWGAFAAKVLEWGPNPRKGSKSDQAHPPIHPTKFTAGTNRSAFHNFANYFKLIFTPQGLMVTKKKSTNWSFVISWRV